MSFIIDQDLKLKERRQEAVKPESIPDSHTHDGIKPLELIIGIGAKVHLPELKNYVL